MFKRVFSKKVKNVTKSVRMSEVMAEALSQLAKQHGETMNSYIVLILDDHLQKSKIAKPQLERIAVK